ncbi:MAG TPA: iron-containing redox enzyme family protein [Stenomitos sp.]
MTLVLRFTDLMRETVEAVDVTTYMPSYVNAERQFIQLLETDNLDFQVRGNPSITSCFEEAITFALKAAYQPEQQGAATDAAHLFLQRILYRINRLNLFWYDNLENYKNERSLYLRWCADRIESAWQAWELQQLNRDTEQLKSTDVKQALIDHSNADLNPPVSEAKRYLREEMTLEGYRYLLSITSLDGLVEASRMSRILGGSSNEIQATLIRVLMEEYGNGRLARKHSTFFANMMAELSLDTEPEAYFDRVPWEVLAAINHNFLLTECKQHFLRYNGGLTYFEVAGPSIYTDYLLAAQRLQCSNDAMGYWELHIREDERHGQWMLKEVALPLADRYPDNAWQLLWGYEQEKFMGDRAGAAMIRAIKSHERCTS